MSTAPIPTKVHDVTRALLDHGWSYMVQQGNDSAGHAYLNITAQKSADSPQLNAWWHTRPTGGKTYRWNKALWNGREVGTLAKLYEVAQESPDA